jgi:hypothetical protein
MYLISAMFSVSVWLNALRSVAIRKLQVQARRRIHFGGPVHYLKVVDEYYWVAITRGS